ncbi:Glycosyltransferase [Vibrio crassostreae]|nr:Glycosyltransferase [Vibrio crassostreae]CAK2564016.1 Glycosyltransferase [Vibrio crassostreae]CAK2577744.1 Glycosyltransferase [Vibrio crassostreae]CAK2577759.1 Glycosyltransferase [Vibrio crassostreae]CAK2577946.1 Glycosyltransferase [Vibrio crassostreae]
MNESSLPLISICMVTYNHQKYVADAIESCLSQTYDNFELIIVDNNSLDKTVDIIRSYEYKSEKIELITLDNNTFPSHAFNLAIRKAKGEYITLLSGDDLYFDFKLSAQLHMMKDKNLRFSFSWVELIDDQKKICEHELSEIFNREFSSFDIKKDFIESGNMLCATSAMFHRDIFEEYGYFDERLLQLQDYDMWLRLSSTEDITLLSHKLSAYRVRGDGENLSLAINDSKFFRSEYEQFRVERRFLDFDLEVLSSIICSECSDSSKYHKLHDYLISIGKFASAKAILDEFYIRLGANINFPSDNYSNFFDLYSKSDFFRSKDLSEISRLRQKVESLEDQVEVFELAANRLSAIESSTTWRAVQPIIAVLSKMKRMKGLVLYLPRIIRQKGLRNTLNYAFQVFKSGGLRTLVHTALNNSARGHVHSLTERDFINKPSVLAHGVCLNSVTIIAELSIQQCTKYRVTQKKEMLELLGFKCEVVSWTDYYKSRTSISHSSVVIFYRVPSTDTVLALIEECKRLNVKTFWEVDDLIFNEAILAESKTVSDLSNEVRTQVLEGANSYKRALVACDMAIASTSGLAESMKAEGVGSVFILENCLDSETLQLAKEILKSSEKKQKIDNKIRIVYGSGTSTHNIDFEEAASSIAKVLRENSQVIFRIIGLLELPSCFDGLDAQVERFELCSYSEYLRLLFECDISIAPLEKYIFNEAKSNIKYIEASIVKLPSVSSPLSAFVDVINDGVNGYIASDQIEWFDKLTKLVCCEQTRQDMAINANTTVLARYNRESIANTQLMPIVRDYSFIKTKPRIVVFNVFYSPRSFGGATIVTEQINKLLQKHKGYEVYVVTTLPVDDALRPYEPIRYEVEGVTVFGVPVPNEDMELYNNKSIVEPVAKILDVVNPDLAHAHCLQGLGVGVLQSCIDKNINYIVTIHDAWWLCYKQFMIDSKGEFCGQDKIDLSKCKNCTDNKKTPSLRDTELRHYLKNACEVLAPSRYTAELHDLNNMHLKPLTVDRNGILMPKTSIVKKFNGSITFGYVGGNTPIKGSDLVLKAFSNVNNSNAFLRIVDNMINLGHKSYPDHILSDVNNCTIVPGYNQNNIDDFFESIDVLLFPSRCKESFGLTVREAIARNVWVITTDSGGVTECIIEGENGNVIPFSSDSKELECAINNVITQYEKLKLGDDIDLPKDSIAYFNDQVDNLDEIYRSHL